MSLLIFFFEIVEWLILCECCFDDLLLILVFGIDVSFYWLIFKLVLCVESEDEVVVILFVVYCEQVLVIFCVVGISFFGQVISDLVLFVFGDNWNGWEICVDGVQICLQLGVIGVQVNVWLVLFGCKIGFDLVLINVCKIGGIVVNNVSGMCCGIVQNSYYIFVGLCLLLVDGICLDSEDLVSVVVFCVSYGELLEWFVEFGCEICVNVELVVKICYKYWLKNIIGLLLNVLVDYDELLDIFIYLMVGFEGIFGFISVVIYDIVLEYLYKVLVLLVFFMVEICCMVVVVFKCQLVLVVELFDWCSLCLVENMQGMLEWVKSFFVGVCVLFIEFCVVSCMLLYEQFGWIMVFIVEYLLEKQVDFSEDLVVYNQFWCICKDIFLVVGVVCEIGIMVIIEDVIFFVE